MDILPWKTAGVNDEWPPIRLSASVDVDPFPLDVFPETARLLADAVAKSVSCPVDFPAAGVLGAASIAIGRSASLLVKSGYFESASVFIAAVGGPSSGKTPALSLTLAPIREINGRLHREWEKAKADWERSKGEDKGPPPKLERICTTDPTTEALGPILQNNPRGIAITPDELTKLIHGFDQYKGGKGGDRPFYLSCWSGQPVQVDRAKNAEEPIFVPRPFLAIAGGLTPDMGSSFDESKGRDDGFIARFLFACPRPIYRPYSEDGVDSRLADDWVKLIGNLWSLKMRPNEGDVVPWVVRMSDDAHRTWIRLCNAHRIKGETEGLSPVMQGVWGKLEQYAARFALILHLMHHADQVGGDLVGQPPELGDDSIERAWKLVEYFKGHALKFHRQSKAKALSDDAAAVLKWIQRRGRIGASSFKEADAIHALKRYRKDRAAFADALDELAERHVIRPKATGQTSKGAGRPSSPEWEINPEVYDLDDKPTPSGERWKVDWLDGQDQAQ